MNTRSAYPPPADASTIYAVGDIHGRLDLLAQIHAAIDRDVAQTAPAHPREVYVGDYIDRGRDSKKVIDCLLARAAGRDVVTLRGNHEQYLMDFVAGRGGWQDWKTVGALATLSSYGVPPKLLSRPAREEDVRAALERQLPATHARFFEDARLMYICEPYIFVHAGLRPGVPIDQQSAIDLMTIRSEFLAFGGDLAHIVVHGHTPVIEPDMRANRINIDTGAYVTHRLTCLRLGPDGARILAMTGQAAPGESL